LSHAEVLETPSFPKGSFVPGVGMNVAVVNFAFSKKLGAISDPISISNAVSVFKISDVREDGVRPLEEVKTSIRVPVMKEKKLAAIKAQVDRFYASLTPASDLLAAASQVQNVTAMRTGSFSPSGVVNGVGRDPKFIGEALSLKQDEISRPFDGNRGYYIIKIISKTPMDTARYLAEQNTLRDQILQEKKSRMISDWLTGLRAKADIVDDREKFYR